MSEQNTETNTSAETPELPEGVRLPPKRGKATKEAGEKQPRAKRTKKPAEPKEEWTPSEDVQQAVNIMRAVAQTGDKKALALLVAEAIEARAEGKRIRENQEVSEVLADAE